MLLLCYYAVKTAVLPNFEVHLMTNFVNKLLHLVELKAWDITWPGT